MEKGVLIFMSVLAVVALINFGVIRLLKVAEEKKANYRKVFWYFYGVLISISGFVNLHEKNEFNLIFILELVVGITILVLNFFGKIETKNPT